MNIRPLLLAAAGSMVLFSSCSKEESLQTEDNPSSVTLNKLKGNYEFVALIAHTESTITASDGGRTEKSVTISDYKTKNNTGTVVIDAAKITSTGMGYSIDTTLKAFFYVNGVLDDEVEMPFTFSVPSFNSIASYKLVGTDSLSSSAGLISLPSGEGGTIPAQESRAKFAFSGDTLILYSGVRSTRSQTVQGVRQDIVSQATTITKLRKKN